MAKKYNPWAQVIRNVCKWQNMKQSEVARRMGEDIRLFSQRMNKTSDFKMSKFVETIETLGCRVIVEPTNIFRLNEECFDIVVSDKKPEGRYFYVGENDIISAADIHDGQCEVRYFYEREDCMNWFWGKEEEGKNK